jgi:hypothetical protein
MAKKNKNISEIYVYSEPYTKFVIQQLEDIKGKSESDVANFIIKDWIGHHIEELKEYGITVSKARELKILKDIKTAKMKR